MKYKAIIKVISILIAALLFVVVVSIILLPDNLFTTDYSTVVLDRNGRLLGAKLADDGQWRFKPPDSVPSRFKTAILAFEDNYFYKHPGINPVSVYNAMIDNIEAGKIVRGGSTISMQVMRLSRDGQSRTILQKFIESFLTIGLEAKYSKDSILNLYCSNAPFGGNIVGLNAASWRYFGHPEYELSWAEAATLAVLPNSPSMIHPGRNRQKLKVKRDNLLAKLLAFKHIDSTQFNLAVLEMIPEKVKPLPNIAPHLVSLITMEHKGDIITTTIDYELQLHVDDITGYHAPGLLQNGINNAAVLVVSTEKKEVLAYIGNINSNVKYKYNDMVRAKRSSGSILKPFLYAAMIGEGIILPNSLVRDIPSYFNGYHPTNYNNKYQGSVPASKALSQSLNVPAIYMLQEYGTGRFLRLLHKLGFTSFTQTPSHYGLTLILGGGEVSLFELVNAYSGMAATLLSYDKYYGEYPVNAYSRLKLTLNNEKGHVENEVPNYPLTASSIWITYESLKNVSRPETEMGWENFKASSKVAWKTGTSHGFKDAWAVGTTADYIVGVWVGNADGEGRNGLSGTKVAAPIMFDVFNILDCNNKFYPAYDELVEVEVCSSSGDLASPNCSETENIFVSQKGASASMCSYHKLVFTDAKNEYRLSQKCTSVSNLKPVSWFVLPPIQEHYYKKTHPGYNTLPPFAAGCEPESNNEEIDFIYPVSGASIYVAVDETMKQREVVFEVSHHYPKSTIYWHLDNKLIGMTKTIHQLPFIPEKGKHTLTVIDENGDNASVGFEVVR